jgi:hypothetical protein
MVCESGDEVCPSCVVSVLAMGYGHWGLSQTAAKASSTKGVWCISVISSFVQLLLGAVALAAWSRSEEVRWGGEGRAPAV